MNVKKREINAVKKGTPVCLSLNDHMAQVFGEDGRQLATEKLLYPLNNVDEDGEMDGVFTFQFFWPILTHGEEQVVELTEENHDSTFGGSRAALYKGEFHILDANIEPDDVILDLGSNLGVFSVVMGKLFPQAHVHAIDASARACKLLRMNAVFNAALNVSVHNIAVGAEELDNVEFFAENEYNTCAITPEQQSLVDNNNNEEDHKVSVGKVRQITLETLLNSSLLNADKIKYAKIDIEGAEIPLFTKIFEKTPELLEKIEYLNLEVHGESVEANQIREKCKDHFGDRLFLQ